MHSARICRPFSECSEPVGQSADRYLASSGRSPGVNELQTHLAILGDEHGSSMPHTRYRESPPITTGSFVSRTISSKVGRRPDFIWLMNSVMGATVLTLVIPGLHHDNPRAGLPRMWRMNMLEGSTGSVAIEVALLRPQFSLGLSRRSITIVSTGPRVDSSLNPR